MDKVKGKDVLLTVLALRSLDGMEKGKERVIYKFSGLTLYTLAKNLRRLSEINDDLLQTKDKLIRKHNLDKKNAKGELSQDPADVEKFLAEWTPLMEKENEILVTKLKLDEFQLDANQIPVTTMSVLEWMIKEQ